MLAVGFILLVGAAPAGRNRVGLSARIGRHRLGPGKYRLAVTPELKGNFGTTVDASFKVV